MAGQAEKSSPDTPHVTGNRKKPLTEDDLNITDALGGNDLRYYILAIVGALTFLAASVVLVPLYLLISAILAIGIAGVTFIVGRHVSLTRARARQKGSLWAATTGSSTPGTGHLPAVYYTYILGSGGHTGEISEFIKRSYEGHDNLHRRYIITSGDTHSPNVIAKLETLIRDTARGQPTGTRDVVRVARARNVHQPLWTAWYTSLLSALSIVNALIKEPRSRPRTTFGADFRYPHVIMTNGPGTGFIVCLVAYVLKLLSVVPADRAKMVYMETWAHINTLSLTGKLFYHSDIADMFIVQHKPLAERIGKPCLQLFKPPVYARSGGS
ncbi:hypothetical protein RB597_005902 [Gaeumannomyces tritici]